MHACMHACMAANLIVAKDVLVRRFVTHTRRVRVPTHHERTNERTSERAYVRVVSQDNNIVQRQTQRVSPFKCHPSSVRVATAVAATAAYHLNTKQNTRANDNNNSNNKSGTHLRIRADLRIAFSRALALFAMSGSNVLYSCSSKASSSRSNAPPGPVDRIASQACNSS